MRILVCVLAPVALASLPVVARAEAPPALALLGADPVASLHHPDPALLRQRVRQLGARARTHSRRLGLRPPPRPRPAAAPSALARQERRLADVVAFLDARREIRRAVDGRVAPPPRPRGRSLAARIAHEHRRATRHAVRLGLDRPRPPRAVRGRAEAVRELARWRAVSAWLGRRTERLRPAERPLAQRLPHYRAFACIARHESGGRWDIATGNGYYGGLQMDRSFQRTYGPGLYRTKGTADNWTPEEQIRVAARAVPARGFTPWPNTARVCGLL